MKIDFTKKLVNLQWQDFENDTKELVADVIMSAREWNSIKLYDIALKVYKEWIVDLDETDSNLIKDVIEKSTLTVIAKWQILKFFTK